MYISNKVVHHGTMYNNIVEYKLSRIYDNSGVLCKIHVYV